MAITKKKVIVFLIFFLIAFLIVFFYDFENYDEKYVIGKTEEEITQKYGEFDVVPMDNTIGYETHGSLYDLLGIKWASLYFGRSPSEIEYFFICFDETGVAYDAYTGGYPGG